MDIGEIAKAPVKGKREPIKRQLTESQLTAIRSIPDHSNPMVPTQEDSRPYTVYTDPERFLREQASIFEQLPVPVTVSALLPEAGAFVANDIYGVPLLLSRDRDGKVHAFLNVCRHRGAKIIEGCDPVKAGRVICPYHAWTYGLKGELVGIPRQETFPSLRKEDLGLIELTCHEAGGLVWVCLKKGISTPMLEGSDAIDADLKALGLDGMSLYGHRTYDLKANWKLVLEPFMESYHIQRLHRNTVAPLFTDNANLMDFFGLHSRSVSGRIEFVPSEVDLSSDRLHKTITHAYNLFPNTVIVTSPYFISVMIVAPHGVDSTVVEYFMLTPEPADSPKGEDLFARSYAYQDEIFREDFGAAVIQQAGLAIGGIDRVHFGGLERQIGPFHTAVESFADA